MVSQGLYKFSKHHKPNLLETVFSVGELSYETVLFFHIPYVMLYLKRSSFLISQNLQTCFSPMKSKHDISVWAMGSIYIQLKISFSIIQVSKLELFSNKISMAHLLWFHSIIGYPPMPSSFQTDNGFMCCTLFNTMAEKDTSCISYLILRTHSSLFITKSVCRSLYVQNQSQWSWLHLQHPPSPHRSHLLRLA